MAERRRYRHAGLSLLLWAGHMAWAAAAPLATDEALEERVNRVSSELRCLVCQNQTVADSQAELAVQLKNTVRSQLQAGATEAQVRDFMVQRYGEFVLYKPPLHANTGLLWGGPLLLLLLGAGLFGVHWWGQRNRRDDADDNCDYASTPTSKTAATHSQEPA